MSKKIIISLLAVFLFLGCFYLSFGPGQLVVAEWFYVNGKSVETKKWYLKSVDAFEKRNSKSYWLGWSYGCLGQLHFSEDNLDYAVLLLDQVKSIKCKDKELYSLIYRAYAVLLEEKEQFEKSEIYYANAIALVDPQQSNYFLLHEDMGIKCSKLKRYKEASEHYEIALKYYENQNDQNGLLRLNNCLSYLHFRQGHRKEALEYALKLRDQFHTIPTVDLKVAVLDTIASAYQLNDDNITAENYMHKAILSYLERS